MTVLAASGHIAYDFLCVVGIRFAMPVRPAAGPEKILLPVPEPALSDPVRCDVYTMAEKAVENRACSSVCCL